jgi:hypothetical protein
VNKKPPELPNIEDATLRACLAPLMEAMNAGREMAGQALAQVPVARAAAEVPVAEVPVAEVPVAGAVAEVPVAGAVAEVPVAGAVAEVPMSRAARLQAVPSGSNDNPLPGADKLRPVDGEPDCTPETLAEWRLQADDDFAALRMVEQFLAMTDVELVTAAAEFPRQITGTVARIGRIKQRLAARCDKVTVAVALLERARMQASADAETD